MLEEVEQQLYSAYGVTMFAPPYSKMGDDVGRVTQKHPGSAENGAVYNHAAVFYIDSLYAIGEGKRACQLRRQMLSGPSEADYLQRGRCRCSFPITPPCAVRAEAFGPAPRLALLHWHTLSHRNRSNDTIDPPQKLQPRHGGRHRAGAVSNSACRRASNAPR